MKKILIVVDMQNDFIDGSLGTPEAEAIVDNVVAKINTYTKDCVYATRDTHQDNYLQTQEGENLPIVQCIEGTYGWQLNEKVPYIYLTFELHCENAGMICYNIEKGELHYGL